MTDQYDDEAAELLSCKPQCEPFKNVFSPIHPAGIVNLHVESCPFSYRPAVAAKLRERGKRIKALEAQIERLKTMSTVEMMCENPNVDAHVREWETRCLKAEERVKALEEAGRRLAEVWNAYNDYRS